MDLSFNILFFLVAFITGACSGYYALKIWYDNKYKKHYESTIKKFAGINDSIIDKNFSSEGLVLYVLKSLVKCAYAYSYLNTNNLITKYIKSDKLPQHIKDLSFKSNMPLNFGNYAYRNIQLKYILCLGFGGCILGFVFSNLLAFILLLIGVCIGFIAPSWAMKKEVDSRRLDLEKNLPEMLEVVAMGLRSGLTFDRSLKIYCNHFSNEFSSTCKTTQKKWESGLQSREEALRSLASAYDSFLLRRTVESIIRSLHFGSTLVENLENSAIEARNIYKTRQEEKVAKAPVKMMLPTGTLILPAMLLLVLGPILLELINGF